jgi:uncharacterized protein (TIGR02246 family)
VEGVDFRRSGDEFEIRNLLARVAQLCDGGDIEDYLDLFTEDAVWEMPDNPQVGVGASVRRGRSSIAEGVRERRAMGIQGPGSATIHVITTIAVQVAGPDSAVSSAYWMYYSRLDKAPHLQSVGHYEDSLRRTPSGWKVARRRITVGGPPHIAPGPAGVVGAPHPVASSGRGPEADDQEPVT